MKVISLISILIFSFQSLARNSGSSNRYQLLSGVKKSRDLKTYWDKKYRNPRYVYGKAPAKFLANNFHYISPGSTVLDMGMGEGRNAVFLALKGHNVTGIDISSVAVKKSRKLAREFGVRIKTVVASLSKYKISPGSFDAIICFYYVDRALIEKMKTWLKPGGIIIFEAYTDLQRNVRNFENYSKKFLLRQGELLNLFKGMKILKYQEPLHLNEFTSSLIIQKPE